MTIDEAIEILQNEVNHGFRCGYENLTSAEELGIEALKLVQRERLLGINPVEIKLPRETEG